MPSDNHSQQEVDAACAALKSSDFWRTKRLVIRTIRVCVGVWMFSKVFDWLNEPMTRVANTPLAALTLSDIGGQPIRAIALFVSFWAAAWIAIGAGPSDFDIREEALKRARYGVGSSWKLLFGLIRALVILGLILFFAYIFDNLAYSK